LPDFTAITEPDAKKPETAEAPPTEIKPADSKPAEALPDLADLLDKNLLAKPQDEQKNNATPATPEVKPEEPKPTETANKVDVPPPAAENNGEKKDEAKKTAKKTIKWPRNFKTQVLPREVYRKHYEQENAHLPPAIYYPEMEAHLFYAAGTNNINGIRALLRAGVPLTIRSPQSGDTLLTYALRYHAFDSARLLIMLGMNPNEPSADGATPLHFATEVGRMDVVELLIHHGANPFQPDRRGISPLQLAQMQGNYPMMELLGHSRYSAAVAVQQPQHYATYMR
jgi:hypothetical protein